MADALAVTATVEKLRPFVFRCIRAEFAPLIDISSADEVAEEVCAAIIRELLCPENLLRPALAVAYEEIRGRSDPIRNRRARCENQVDQMLDALPSVERDVLLLRIAGELSAEDAALALGISPGAVRLYQHRAMNRLREQARAAILAGK